MSTGDANSLRTVMRPRRVATMDDLAPAVLPLPPPTNTMVPAGAPVENESNGVRTGAGAAALVPGSGAVGDEPPERVSGRRQGRRGRTRSRGPAKRRTTKLDARFIHDCLAVLPGACVSSRDLWEAYLTWCIDNQAPPLRSCNVLTRKLRDALPGVIPGGHKHGRTWRNLTLIGRNQP